ncbi:V-type ATP synthase subunit A [Thiohalorhabdus sp.]|uniref:V-type ATP synthase subunit A n=1 Tax=Thiohalorhabdus sp. TaxID=3094134 RepID=UPI002FC310ED
MSEAAISHIRGPVLHAQAQGPFAINESVRIGRDELLGEVLSAHGDEVTVQVYEDTTNLRPGDPVSGTGTPLAVQLGPGILGRIFDGLLRPLSGTDSDFVQPGIYSAQPGEFPFEPLVTAEDQVSPGAAFGRIDPEEGRTQDCLVPPEASGEVIAVAAPGTHREDATVLRLRDNQGREHAVAMSHTWPVRKPRPIGRRTELERPLITGQRLFDALFPVARGGTAAMPGGFGTGKTVLQQSLAKWCEADVIVYVGCGERGNEMSEVLHEFPQLEDPRTGRPLLERSVIIANTSNMPVAAREASIYTGVTVAEYFRDQGLHVALMADSTSRWAEALREISGRLGELPAEGGYPAYLASRLAEFYERAAPVETLGGDNGSVTLIGAVSPPGGDFSEPVTVQTKRFTRCFWPLDRDRARSRFFPAIHPLQAYSEDVADLAPWWRQQEHPEWDRQRRRFLGLLEEEQRLQRMARIVGKASLPPQQQLTLLCAELVNEAFLRQSAFDEVDRYTSPARQAAMMQTLDRFLDRAQKAVQAGVPVDRVKNLSLMRRLRRMGLEIGEEELGRFDELTRQVDDEFDRVNQEEDAQDAG